MVWPGVISLLGYSIYVLFSISQGVWQQFKCCSSTVRAVAHKISYFCLRCLCCSKQERGHCTFKKNMHEVANLTELELSLVCVVLFLKDSGRSLFIFRKMLKYAYMNLLPSSSKSNCPVERYFG